MTLTSSVAFQPVRSLLILLLALCCVTQPDAIGQTFERLFTDRNPGRKPSGDLLLGRDGCFYGTSQAGGTSDFGTIFKVTPAGEVTTVACFNNHTGSVPNAVLVQGSDGSLYGTAARGGANDYGTVFKVTPDGVLTRLASFNSSNGSYPNAGLVEGSDGNFYGTTIYGGVTGSGTLFRITPAGELTTLISFNTETIGGNPEGELLKGSDGNLYGTTSVGGAAGAGDGTVFKITPAGEFTTLAVFNGSNGRKPIGALVEGNDGNFYGATTAGGASGYGTIFKVTPAGVLTEVASFVTSDGRDRKGGLLRGSDGNFYGTTYHDGVNGGGTLFKVTPAGEFTSILSFDAQNGRNPRGGLIAGNDGSFYGTTESGGEGGYGTVFKVTPGGLLTTLASFRETKGENPSMGLIQASDGAFYGTNYSGGKDGDGSVFKMTPDGVVTELASFNSTNGKMPTARLLEGEDGSFYGTTYRGGTNDNGTVFKVTPSGELTTLVLFDGTNGSAPNAELVKGDDGNFYGTTDFGGVNNLGTFFKMTPAGELTTLSSFSDITGRSPSGGLTKGGDGYFYGTAPGGGVNNLGTIFRVTPAGQLAALFYFDRNQFGSNPLGELVKGNDGDYYGTTGTGGKSNFGTVFKFTPELRLTTLVSFTGPNGNNPVGGLVKGNDGNFYGTTFYGGAFGYGTIFRITPAGVLTTLYSFDGDTATHPLGTPVFGSDGKLYGMAAQMTAWRLWLADEPAVSVSAPAAITTTSASFSGTINANGADTTVTFEYGLTPAYGNSVDVTPKTISGRDTTPVSATLAGLLPHTTYYYRLKASNSEGTTVTAATSFTTADNAPVAANDSFAPVANDFGAMTLQVLANDSDADGDTLTISRVTQGAFGSVTISGNSLIYTPGPGFAGRDSFSYVVSDGFEESTARVDLRTNAFVSRVFLAQGSKIPGAGQSGSEFAQGSLFKSFGVPAINSAGRTTFVAGYSTPGSPRELSIVMLDPNGSMAKQAARLGQTAPGTQGALFSSFKDPLINEAGEIAFVAALSDGDTTKKNREGIWISSGSGTQLIARMGTQPPGAPTGAHWKSFTSMVFSSPENHANADVNQGDGNWSLAFTGFMNTGAGGINASNDMGLWIARTSGTVLALREGQKLQIGGTEKKLRTFAALMPLSNATGQGNGATNEGAVSVQAFFTDGSQAVLRVSHAEAGEGIDIEAVALPGDPVAGSGETAGKFGLPAQSDSGAVTAWTGTLSGRGKPAAVFERNLSEPELLRLLARRGDAAPGIDGASFGAFRSVAVSDTGGALLLGKVTGKGITASSDEGLWWRKGSGESSSLQLLAREGSQPPGVPEGARWKAFTSLALSGGEYGSLFTATLASGSRGKAGSSEITSANDQGLWAVDSKGELQLIVQKGQEVVVDESGTLKKIKSFTVLSAVPGSPTQRRSFNNVGRIVYRALFTDGSYSIIAVQLP